MDRGQLRRRAGSVELRNNPCATLRLIDHRDESVPRHYLRLSNERS